MSRGSNPMTAPPLLVGIHARVPAGVRATTTAVF
jgi:hypothetical protein